MNNKVKNGLISVIQAWKMADRDYTFESRGFAGFMMSPIVKGEALMRFHIAIDGFFEDKEHTKPVTLDYSSDLFQTTIISVDNPVNPNADAIRLKAFLDSFTADVYHDAIKILATYATSYTSDPIHMK